MKIRIEESNHKFKILFSEDYEMSDLEKWEIFLGNILSSVTGSNVNFITVDPVHYSIGKELKNSQKLKRKGKEYLINWDIRLTESVLSLIKESDEFERRLLIILLEDSIVNLFSIIEGIESDTQFSLEELEIELIAIENDGRIFLWNCCPKDKREAIKKLLPSL